MIRSKPEAANWVMQQLPEMYRPVIERAKLICTGKHEEYWDDLNTLLKPCAEVMENKIQEKVDAIDFNDVNNKGAVLQILGQNSL